MKNLVYIHNGMEKKFNLELKFEGWKIYIHKHYDFFSLNFNKGNPRTLLFLHTWH